MIAYTPSGDDAQATAVVTMLDGSTHTVAGSPGQVYDILLSQGVVTAPMPPGAQLVGLTLAADGSSVVVDVGQVASVS